MQGLIGRKLGMTQVFDGEGARVAVTVIEAGPCVVLQRKTKAVDGYEAVQLGFGERKESHVTKATLGRAKAANVTPRRWLAEFPVGAESPLKSGDTVNAKVLEGATHVDVSGVTKGKGFQGVVRRHGMRGGPKTHGGHSKRRVGSIGSNSYPARVHKGHRMPGHMGAVSMTQQNLRIVEVRGDDNLVLLGGAVPGPNGAIVLLRKALKKAGKAA
jgi:large subunit ribosomal protein L3